MPVHKSRRAFLAELSGSMGWAFTRSGRTAVLPAPPPSRRILYIAGRLSGQREATIRETVEKLGPSEFNVAILAFLYVRFTNGRLRMSYNGTPAGKWHPRLPGYLRQLQRGYPIRKKILLSLGGWGNRGTFEAIRAAGVPGFLRQLDDEVVGPLGLDGLDLDLEPSTAAENTAAGWHAVHDDLGATLVALTNGYRERHPDHAVTHAPIASVAAALYARDGGVRGVRGSILEATRGLRGGNNISWLNVQFYEAGDPKPASIPDFYRNQLLLPLLEAREQTGIAWPWEALVPGFEPRYHQTLVVCEQALGALRRAIAANTAGEPPGGAFVWQYGQIAGMLASWGQGLRGALAGRALP